MTEANKNRAIREKVADYRARMRARGLRPVQIWVPDTRTETFHAEAHNQSLAIAHSRFEQEDQKFIDAISTPDGQ
ncbi:MAG: antitoxin MazE family protein [Alphaproteobacteria bacterium]